MQQIICRPTSLKFATRPRIRSLLQWATIVLLSAIAGCPILVSAQPFRHAQAGDTQLLSDQVFVEDFESGVGDWFADNGVWEVGEPAAGPDSAFSGNGVAGTVLGSDYPNGANSRLISPEIVMPELESDEELQLRFWHWFDSNPNDSISIQVSQDGVAWESIGSAFYGTSGAWTQYLTVDLSSYEGVAIRVAFLLISDGNNQGNSGWYIDALSISTASQFGAFRNPEGFELGIGDWYASNGVWEIGIPDSSPDAAYGGIQVAGTVLTGDYPRSANSRLISPPVMLIPLAGASPTLRFWHWFDVDENDRAVLQISKDGSAWQDISSPFVGTSSAWTQYIVNDLSAYTGSVVRFAFLLISDGNNRGNNGWYVDDFVVGGIAQSPTSIKTEGVPASFVVHGAYPNPFNPTSTIQFDLRESAEVILRLFNVLGHEVHRIDAGRLPAGKQHELRLDAGMLASGTYVYLIEGHFSGRTENRQGRLVLVR